MFCKNKTARCRVGVVNLNNIVSKLKRSTPEVAISTISGNLTHFLL